MLCCVVFRCIVLCLELFRYVCILCLCVFVCVVRGKYVDWVGWVEKGGEEGKGR